MQTDNTATAAGTSRYGLGLALLGISLFFYFLPVWTGMTAQGGDSFGFFCINFAITASYLFLGRNILKGGSQFTRDRFIFLLLFLISAYALNRSIPVFEESATWLGVLLLVSGAAYLALPHLSSLPLLLRQLVVAIIGVAILLWVYLALYLLPIYPFSIFGVILFGVSLHVLVPGLLLYYTILWLSGAVKRERRLAVGFGIGMLAALVVTGIYCADWQRLNQATAKDYQRSLIDDNSDLPSWVKVSKHLPHTWATEQFLMGDLVYTTARSWDEDGFWRTPRLNMDAIRRHDPLVMIASLFSNTRALNREDRIRILESKYDARHHTEERLWSGAHLRTTAVITNANIWPALHLAYTEQIITVANQKQSDTWRRQKEAIYSFHLPEGSAVTSLSLWINGKESKGILTTKGKADSAYKQIVGVEQRDPSVVHWAEGNRIRVRVFPVIAGDHRIFKIGVTSPLVERGGKLHYQPMSMEGPAAEGATGITQLTVAGSLKGSTGLQGFKRDVQGRYRREGSFEPDWSLSFDAPSLQQSVFSFNGHSYTLQSYQPQRESFSPTRIYLDLNKSWTREEYEAVAALGAGRKLYACTDEVVRLTEDNKEAVFEASRQSDFSLFPLFSIAEPESALIITKNTPRSPNLKDLAGSDFATKLEQKLHSAARFRLFNLGTSLSPYLKTLKEHRAFHYERGSVEDLKALIAKNEFAGFPETDTSIVIDDAGMRITKSSGMLSGNGPDHLQRLFAYNHLIQHLGKSLYTNMEHDTALVQEAQEAYVVSPLSSLVVLESAQDYERFGIKDDATSLKNAAVKSAGAVPEPHEWALIMVALCLLVWMRYRQQLRTLIVRR